LNIPDDARGLFALTKAISKDSLSSLNLSNNSAGVMIRAAGWDLKKIKKGVLSHVLKWVHADGSSQTTEPLEPQGCFALVHAMNMNANVLSELNISGNNIEATGTKHIANAVKHMSSLSFLDISNNNIAQVSRMHDVTGVISLVDAIKDAGVMTELNVAHNCLGASGAVAIANVMKDMTTLSSLNITGNKLVRGSMIELKSGECRYNEQAYYHDTSGVMAISNAIKDSVLSKFTFGEAHAITMTTEMADGDFSCKSELSPYNVHEAQLVASFLSKCQALSKLTFGNNPAVIMTTDMTEADFSGKLSDYEGPIASAFLPKCQVLSCLNLSSNHLDAGCAEIIAKALDDMVCLSSLDISNNPGLGLLSVPEGWETSTIARERRLGANFDSTNDPSTPIFRDLTVTTPELVWAVEPPPGANPKGMTALVIAIMKHRVLVSVNMFNNLTLQRAYMWFRPFDRLVHPALKSICGNSGAMTELDIRGKMVYPAWIIADAFMVAVEITGNEALTKVIFGSGDRTEVLEVGMTAADFSNKNFGANETAIILAWVLVKGLSKLNLANNAPGLDEAFFMAMVLTSTIDSRAVNSNTALTELDVRNNKFNDDQTAKLQQAAGSKGIRVFV
jgi:Leucine-rich repeat (LRR) protein